jgi:hypothetical protein
MFLAFGLVAGPWVLILSLKYGRLMFSSTPGISHALTGPPDMDRYHPFARAFHRPERGRITSWEDPTRMAYNYWSPLESRAYASHEVKVLAQNLSTCLMLLASLNVAWLAWLVALPLERMRRGNWPAWAWLGATAMIVPALLALVYLPCYVTITEQRFFYPAFPFLFAALAAWAVHGGEVAGGAGKMRVPRGGAGKMPAPQARSRETGGWWLAVAGALLPFAAAAFVIGATPKFAGECACDLSRRIANADLAGPIAGSGMLPGGRAGLYVAFLLDQPWYGDEKRPTPASLAASGARLIVAVRHSELAAALDRDLAFEDLDTRLFPSPAEADNSPLKVYASVKP